jgi:hypothetical protein
MKVADTAIGHETQLHGLRLVRIGHAQTPAGFTDLRLGELTKRKNERFKRRLRQTKQEVALIFVVIAATQQPELAIGCSFQTSIVSRRDVRRVEAASHVRQVRELDRAVAAHARDRRATRLVLDDERVDDVLAKRLPFIEDVVRDAEVLTGASGVVAVFGSAASAHLLLAVRIPQMERHSNQVVSCLMQQRRGD